jgi:hypothetical protein
MKKQPSHIKQFSQFFQVPVLTLYVIIGAVIVFAGVFASSGALQQKQSTEGLAGSAQEQTVECNQACTHNHQCPPNHFCFNRLCRLVTNPHSPYCDPLDETAKTAPPSTPVTKTPPTAPKTGTQLQSCNEPCANNNQCEPNHFCYQGQCRLVSHPEDQTCGQTTTPVATSPATQPTLPPMPTSPPATEPAETGLPFIPLTPEPEEKTATGIAGLINDFLADSDTSIFFVLGLGVVGLIILVAIVTFISSKKKVEYQPSDFSGLEKTPQPSQENNQTIPINPSAEIADESSETQPTYGSSEDENDASQASTSNMMSRLKEKEIELPQEESPDDQPPSENS